MGAGRMVLGTWSNTEKHVIVMQGRVHPYEGVAYCHCTFYIWVLRELGVRLLVLTNAAGGLNPSFRVGQICLIKDHVDLAAFSGGNPLFGLRDLRLMDQRFVDMSAVYDVNYRQALKACALQEGLADDLVEGIFVMRAGPTFETPAEGRVLRHVFGADVVGMSTVYEAAVARAINLPVIALSLVTNPVTLQYKEDNNRRNSEAGKSGNKGGNNIENNERDKMGNAVANASLTKTSLNDTGNNESANMECEGRNGHLGRGENKLDGPIPNGFLSTTTADQQQKDEIIATEDVLAESKRATPKFVKLFTAFLGQLQI